VVVEALDPLEVRIVVARRLPGRRSRVGVGRRRDAAEVEARVRRGARADERVVDVRVLRERYRARVELSVAAINRPLGEVAEEAPVLRERKEGALVLPHTLSDT